VTGVDLIAERANRREVQSLLDLMPNSDGGHWRRQDAEKAFAKYAYRLPTDCLQIAYSTIERKNPAIF